MRSFEELISEAGSADVSGWGFAWLDGRATEERPPWGYAKLLAERLCRATATLDLDTGGGEVISEAPMLPPHMVVTEDWAPNAEQARLRFGHRGVWVVETAAAGLLPFADASFDLVTARHPVSPNWGEVARVLQSGGHYFAQHVACVRLRARRIFPRSTSPGTSGTGPRGRDRGCDHSRAGR